MTSTFWESVVSVKAGQTIGPIALSYSNFPRSSGWSLVLEIMGTTGLQSSTAAASDPDNTDGFILTVAASVTASWQPERTSFTVWAQKTDGDSTIKCIAEEGMLTVRPNPAVKTQAMTILESIRSVMAGLATDGQRTVVLDGIQLRNMTPAELEQWEGRYNRIVNAQIGKAGGNGGVYAIKMRTPQDNRYAAPWYGAYPPPGGTR